MIDSPDRPQNVHEVIPRVSEIFSEMQPSIGFPPTVINPFPQTERELVAASYCSRRFRRILPKLEPNAPLNSEISPSAPKVDPQSLQNPYIIIIPRLDSTKISKPNNVRLPSVSKRKPILRITINKMSNIENKNVLDESTEMRSSQNGFDTREHEDEPRTERVEVRNYKLNRSVVFSLDPITGEILVTKRAIESNSCASENDQDVNKRRNHSSGNIE